jgi:LCP family protein required for cell wall assembly
MKRLTKKQKILIILGIVAVVLVVAFNTWQESYLTLPVPEVQPPDEEGIEPPIVTAGFDKFDILLLGLDSREGEPELGARTDTMLLVSIDPSDYYARILSIPRDTRVYYRDGWRKINEVYYLDGVEGSVKAVEELLNSRIDRYAVVDFQGVIELVDLMGGIIVDVPKDMYKPLENIDLKKGPEQHLNGYDALAYMRYRDEWLSDMDRSERQKEVLIQLADKLLSPSNIFKLPAIANTALAYMETSVSLQEILTLAKYGRTILYNGIENMVLPGINDYYFGGWYYVPFLEELGLPLGRAEIEYREYLVIAAQEAKAAAESQAEEEMPEEEYPEEVAPEGEDLEEAAPVGEIQEEAASEGETLEETPYDPGGLMSVVQDAGGEAGSPTDGEVAAGEAA